ncbi:hypothetical protein MPER_09777 [Moniliophthora perniciosa FA553]|nr:hypothetical protein MPER_09777 [Moniliophthora perniciosa FA553]
MTARLVSYGDSSSEDESEDEVTRSPFPMDVDNSAVTDTTSANNTVISMDDDPSVPLPAILQRTQAIIPDGDEFQWARDAFSVLTTGDALVEQPVWQHILDQYFVLQGTYSFVNPDKNRLPANLRPDEFSRWFKEGRKPDLPFNMRRLEPFTESLWEWWNVLNPDWRKRLEKGRMSRAKDGEWDDLRYPGQNGLILPIVGLRWWFILEKKEHPSPDWNEMAQDVLWVLESLVKWENEHPDSPLPTGKAPASSKPLSGAKRPAASSSSKPHSKKARTR